jgi:hypothetical protein
MMEQDMREFLKKAKRMDNSKSQALMEKCEWRILNLKN